VGAIDEFDDFAYFSNYGRCVEIQAPVSYLSNHFNLLKLVLDLWKNYLLGTWSSVAYSYY